MPSFGAAISLIAVLLISGCVPENEADFSTDLGGGYQLFQWSSHHACITLSNNLEDMHWIPPKVIRCNFDEHFIIAQQQLLKRKYPNDPQRSVEIPDPGKFQYWIIVKSSQQRHGPYTAEEFEAQRTVLGVPKSLELQPKDSFRPR